MSSNLDSGFPGGSDGKESAHNVGDLGWEDPLEEGMAAHLSILAWRIPWTEEPGGLQFMGSQKIGYDRVTDHNLDSDRSHYCLLSVSRALKC